MSDAYDMHILAIRPLTNAEGGAILQEWNIKKRKKETLGMDCWVASRNLVSVVADCISQSITN